MSALDLFKRRLVRDIARRLHQEKQTEDAMWKEMANEYGCDCFLLWQHMKTLTLKKLKRLLAADDRQQNIAKIARMTSTDWLTFDLVLVHEKVDVIGEDMILSGNEDSPALYDLFDLVVKFGLESQKPIANLKELWMAMTKIYNICGRQSSPMLLQRRWYQLKEISRKTVYDFWHMYRGNPRNLLKACVKQPSKLQLKIAERFPYLITQPFIPWKDLISTNRVALISDFENRRLKIEGIRRNNRTANSSSIDNDPDIAVVEQQVETVEVIADSDSDDAVPNDAKVVDDIQIVDDQMVTVKSEPEELLENNDVDFKCELDEVEIDNTQFGETSIDQEYTEATDFTIAGEADLNLPKITSVRGNVIVPESHDENDATTSPTVNCNKTDVLLNLKTEDNISNSHKIIYLDDLPSDLKFVDDGIELLDSDLENDGKKKIDQIYEDNETSTMFNNHNKLSGCGDEINGNLDRKLLMYPIVYTKKLDRMNIFKNTGFLTIKGNQIIESAVEESKPVFEDTIAKEEFNEDEIVNNTELCKFPKVKYTSWLLQKPKHRNYNPIQLCKNPDFNTRLKRLTVGFFSSERNRQLFNACKPVTIDIHKAFETKLVNNTMYLEGIVTPVVKEEKKDDTCENTVSVLPSAMAVQSLLDNSKLNVKDLLPQQEVDEPEPLLKHRVTERSKVINLPDINQIRCLNQNLPAAEVSPISLNITSTVNEPEQLDEPPKVEKNLKEINIDEVITELSNSRYKGKKTSGPKFRPSIILPQWSLGVQYHNKVDSLITKDTLTKVLRLLKGDSDEYPEKINKTTYVDKDTNKDNRKIVVLDTITDNQENNNKNKRNNKYKGNKHNNNKGEAVMVNDKDFNNSVTSIETPNTVIQEKGTPTRKKRLQTISRQSDFCCWAQYKIQTYRNCKDVYKKKLRHLCKKPLCKCCCRLLLVDEMASLQGEMLDKSHNTHEYISPRTEIIMKRDVSIQANSTVDQNGRYFIASSVVFYPCESQSIVDSRLNDQCSTQKNLTKILPSSVGSIQAEIKQIDPLRLSNDVACNTSDSTFMQKDIFNNEEVEYIKQSTTTHEPEQPMIKIISGEVFPTKVSVAKLPTTVDNRPSLCQRKRQYINNNKIVETISLIDDETIDSTKDISRRPNNSKNTVLPEGVNLLLLPNNSLSVSINPDAKINQNSLSKLPEILTAVQKQLFGPRGIQYLPKNNQLKCVETDVKTNITNENIETIVVNSDSEPNIETESAVRNINSIPEPNTLESNDEPIISLINNLPSSSSQSSPNLNDVHCITENNNSDQDTGDEGQNNQSEQSSETGDNCDLAADANRKTILSDLMTMSGISPEDGSFTIEGPKQLALLPSASTPPLTPPPLTPSPLTLLPLAPLPLTLSPLAPVPIAPVPLKPIPIAPSPLTSSPLALKPLDSSSTSNTVFAYSVSNKPKYIVNLKNPEKDQKNKSLVIKGKMPIKKVMLVIKKNKKQNVPLAPDTVIDLTDDCDKQNDNGQQDKSQINDKTMQRLISKYVVDIKDNNIKHVNKSAVPMKLYKVSKSVLKTATEMNTGMRPSCEIVATNNSMKLTVARQYRQMNRKPNILNILNRIKKSKQIQQAKEELNKEKRRNSYTGSDSSDDEPLAKKSKRMKDNIQTGGIDINSGVSTLVPIEEYEVPIEFVKKPSDLTETLEEHTTECSDSDGEDCILGV